MSVMSNTPMLSLSAVSGSFPFQTKYIPLSRDVKVTLGAAVDLSSGEIRASSAPTNGWFARQRGGLTVSPLSLSVSHCQVWWDGQMTLIRDLDSPFGTYVNDVKITGTTVLKTGDIVSLGSEISRNTHTPSDITDEQLKPIIAKATLTGVSS